LIDVRTGWEVMRKGVCDKWNSYKFGFDLSESFDDVHITPDIFSNLPQLEWKHLKKSDNENIRIRIERPINETNDFLFCDAE